MATKRKAKVEDKPKAFTYSINNSWFAQSDKVDRPLIDFTVDDVYVLDRVFIAHMEVATTENFAALVLPPIGWWQRLWVAVARFALRRAA